MLKRNPSLMASVIAVVLAIGAVVGPASAQKMAVPKQQPDKLALGEGQVKQLLLLMDTDQNGKISKQEWMKFMEAEFERLDTDHSGDLDATDLASSRLEATPKPFAAAGK